MKRKFLNAETKLAVLQLVEETGNIAFVCFSAGISRSLYYKIKKDFERGGVAGLQPAIRRKPKMPNAFPEDVIARILEETRKFPSYSYHRISQRLRAAGLSVSGSGVQKVWKRRNLTRKNQRRLWSLSPRMPE